MINTLLKVGLYINLSFSAPQDSSIQLKKLQAEVQHPMSEQLLADLLSRYHYQKATIDDQFSIKVYNKYLKLLDYNRLYFLKSDIKHFNEYQTNLDDELLTGKSEIGFEIYNTYLTRLWNRFDYVNKVLKDTFDFTKDEYYAYDRENSNWFEDTDEQDRYWKQRLKYEALSLKTSGKNGVEINENLRKRYENFRKQISKSKNEDAFQSYMNAFTGCIDPHTDYFSPRSAEDFKVNMSQSLEGIGATLTTESDYTKVRELVKGGPADRSKKIKAGDRITAVGQGQDGSEMVDVIGWRIDDVVSLIRGKKDTYVRLQIISVDAAPGDPQKIITIQRDKIKLEEQRAKGEIKKFKSGKKTYKIGYIDLPIFYQGTSSDIDSIITRFKKDKMDALVMDLRGNTGGSLQEAIWLTGMFIKSGPVVQVKHAAGNVEIDNDQDPNISWNGPMAVMVNRGSASASEIFAAALQDYGRAVIIGDRTFGKGTVQNVIDMNNMGVAFPNKAGQVKMTIAKFYRINGGSTQHKGVVPDINFPTLYDTLEFGESSDPYALKYDEVPTSMFERNNKLFSSTLSYLNTKHDERMKTSKEYSYLLDDVLYMQKQREEKLLPLSESATKTKQKQREDEDRKRLNERRIAKGLPALNAGEKAPENEPKLDFLLDETEQILSDLIEMSK
jgi:carboxyl-terminal processing protease